MTNPKQDLQAAVDRTINKIPDSEARAFAVNKCAFRPFESDYAACVLPPHESHWTIVVNQDCESAETVDLAIVQAIARALIGKAGTESERQARDLCNQWGFSETPGSEPQVMVG